MTRGFGAGGLAQFFHGDEHLAQGQGQAFSGGMSLF
jgi:hypothetical protein